MMKVGAMVRAQIELKEIAGVINAAAPVIN